VIRFRASYDYHTILEGWLLRVIETSRGDKLYMVQTPFQKFVVTSDRVVEISQSERELEDWM